MRLDVQRVRRAFSRASASYLSAATLQAEIEARLLESLDYYAEGRDADAQTPSLVVDLGCGPGRASRRRRPRLHGGHDQSRRRHRRRHNRT